MKDKTGILIESEDIETWPTAPIAEALELQRPLSGGMLRIVARGQKKDGQA